MSYIRVPTYRSKLYFSSKLRQKIRSKKSLLSSCVQHPIVGVSTPDSKWMREDCMVCDSNLKLSKTHIKNVFDERLRDNKCISEVLADILTRSLDEKTAPSKLLCQKCYRRCLDYDDCKKKMNSIKTELSQQYNVTTQKSPIKVTPMKPLGKVVVPASKLLPVPADFQLNFGQLSQAVSKANVLNKNKAYNLKLSVGSSLLNPQAITPTVKITTPSDSSTILSTVNNDITQDWNTNMVPANIFSTTEDENQNVSDENQTGIDENQTGSDENQTGNDENGDEEENEMEIDEDCSMAVVPVKTEAQTDFINIKTENCQLGEYTDIITLTENGLSKSGKYVLSNFNIYNTGNDDDDDDVEHTIVVNGDNASILEMMTGQKVIYENGGLSLVMEEEGDNDDDDDAQDSDEESQIELQVSGDEETTNAIIAAAQEQGGAFIKVESGEMYRVKSIASAEQSLETPSDLERVLTVHGHHYTCNLCKEEHANKFMDRTEMMHHLDKVHDIIVNLPQNRGRKKQDPPAEERKLNNKRAHGCNVCDKYFNSRTLLSEHMNTHTGAKPFMCHICDKGFASKYTHQSHLKTHKDRSRPFQCAQCNKAFLTIHNLKQHEKTHSGIKNFICQVCNKAFATLHNLEIHGVVHTRERNFVCAECGKGFCRKAELTDHKRTHTGERPFACDMCGARFAQRSNLHSHRRATHLDDKRHQCPDCHKRFKRRRLLDYHIKASHTGERPLKCEICGASFVYPEHYKKHLKIHSGIKPFFCEICGKSFNSRDNRNIHRFIHSEKKPYECLACGNSYMRKRLLIQHMNESGHLAESIVVNQPRVTRVQTTAAAEADALVQAGSTEPAIFCTTGKLESLDKTETTIVADDGGKFFIDSGTLDTGTNEKTLMEAINTNPVEEQATHFGTDENGAVIRLIQVKLPNGTDGWVALND